MGGGGGRAAHGRATKIGKRGKTKKLSVSIVGACNVWRVRSRPAKHAGCRAPRLLDTQHAGTRVRSCAALAVVGCVWGGLGIP